MQVRAHSRKFAPHGLACLKAGVVWSPVLLAVAAFMLTSAGPAHAASQPSDSVHFSAAATSGNTFAQQGQAEPTPPSPLLYLDIWVFGGLVLLVALIVAVKYLWKAFQPDDRDPSEGLQPWERPDYDDK